ncbi:MAG: FkbM family methyltransferase [Candidatus Comchoanobacterales bacterium]
MIEGLKYIKSEIKRCFKIFLFDKATKNGSLFLKIDDCISRKPAVGSPWEEELTSLIESYALNGASDFFIDVGANIGLTSCQNGKAFKKVICFEPNTLCANILKTNLAITLNNGQYEVNEFGLGLEEGSFDLHIPKNNWGGAFIRSGSNEYGDDFFIKTHQCSLSSKEKFTIVKVKLKKALDVFEALFNNMKDQGFSKGVCKIDVEGCEKVVLLALAKKLPPSFELNIIFENHSEALDLKEIKDAFGGRLHASKVIMRGKRAKKYFNKKVSLLNLIRVNVYDFNIDEGIVPTGDIVLEIKS